MFHSSLIKIATLKEVLLSPNVFFHQFVEDKQRLDNPSITYSAYIRSYM